MRMTAMPAQTERKRQHRSAHCTGEHRSRARTRRLCGLIRPAAVVRAIANADQVEKRLPSEQIRAIFTLGVMPLGECGPKEVRAGRDIGDERMELYQTAFISFQPSFSWVGNA